MLGGASESKGKRAELAADPRRDAGTTVAVAANQRGEVRIDGGDGQTVGAIPATQSGKQLQGVLTPWDVQSKRIFSEKSVSQTINAGTKEGKNIQPIVMQSVYCRASTQANAEECDNMCPTMSARQYKDPPIIIDRAAYNQGSNALYRPHIEQTQLMDTLVARGPHAVCVADATTDDVTTMPNDDSETNVAHERQYVVRRLTPLECERLQGFKDGWTKVPYRGRPADECPDTPRYKAIGNSMAIPVMRWIGRRIQMVDGTEPDRQQRLDI